MARKRVSGRSLKEQRARDIQSMNAANIRMIETALRALKNGVRELGDLLAELSEKESPQCSDSSPPNPREN